MANGIKTVLLLGLMSGVLLALGDSLGGANGLVIAFIFAAIMNLGSYWFSDKIVLRMYRAQQVGPEHQLYRSSSGWRSGRTADAEGLHHSGSVAERVCDRPQSRRTRPWRRPRASCRSSAKTSSKA